MVPRRIATVSQAVQIPCADHRLSERATSYYKVFTEARIQSDGSLHLHRRHTFEGAQGSFQLSSKEVVRLAPILSQLAKQIQEVQTCGA
jgi:hypothetical protein